MGGLGIAVFALCACTALVSAHEEAPMQTPGREETNMHESGHEHDHMQTPGDLHVHLQPGPKVTPGQTPRHQHEHMHTNGNEDANRRRRQTPGYEDCEEKREDLTLAMRCCPMTVTFLFPDKIMKSIEGCKFGYLNEFIGDRWDCLAQCILDEAGFMPDKKGLNQSALEMTYGDINNWHPEITSMLHEAMAACSESLEVEKPRMDVFSAYDKCEPGALQWMHCFHLRVLSDCLPPKDFDSGEAECYALKSKMQKCPETTFYSRWDGSI